MTVTPHIYAKSATSLATKLANLTSDTIKVGLCTSSYTPNLATDQFWSTPQANEVTGTGYSAGGATVSSPTLTTTAANSWGTTWVTATAKVLGQIIKPVTGNTYLYAVVVAGTTGGSEPTWPTTVGTTVTDGGVTWLNIGKDVTVFTTATPPSWNASGGSLAAAYAVFYDSTPGTAGTDPLLFYWDLGGTQTATNAAFTLTPDASSGLIAWPAS